MAERACPLSQFSRPRTAGVCVSGPRRTTISPSLHATRFTASLRVDELDARWGQFAAIQDFPGLPPHRPPERTKTRHAVELGQHPALIPTQECRHVPFARARRLHDLDSAWTDPNAGLAGAVGDDDAVVHAAASQHYPLLSYGLHPSDTPSDVASSSTAGFRNGGSAALVSNPSRS